MSLDRLTSIGSTVDSVFAAQNVIAQQPFSEQLLTEMSVVNDKLVTAENALQDLATGKSSNIHHVMLALEDAKLSFQLLAQVRNKLLEGYQDILRMQI